MKRQPLTRNLLKRFSSLHLHKFRQKYQLFVVAGEKIAAEVVRDASHIIEAVLIDPAYSSPFAISGSIPIYESTELERSKISSLSTPPAILLICDVKAYERLNTDIESDFVLVLDGISDPGNLGTIIRTCDWFGIKKIFTTQESVNLYHPRLIQATMGSFLRVRLSQITIADIQTLPRPTFGCTLNGQDYKMLQNHNSGTIIMGSESHGISSELTHLLDYEIKIPGVSPNGAESLNVAVATGIVLASLIR